MEHQYTGDGLGLYDRNRASWAYIELKNIQNIAIEHKKHCNKECNISLTILKMTAKRLINYVWDTEKQAALHIIDSTEWY